MPAEPWRITLLPAVMTHGVRSHAIKLIDKVPHRGTACPVDEEVDEAAEEKRDEGRRACALMGINEVHFLEYTDDILLEREDLIRQIADLIQEDYCATLYGYHTGLHRQPSWEFSRRVRQ